MVDHSKTLLSHNLCHAGGCYDSFGADFRQKKVDFLHSEADDADIQRQCIIDERLNVIKVGCKVICKLTGRLD